METPEDDICLGCDLDAARGRNKHPLDPTAQLERMVLEAHERLDDEYAQRYNPDFDAHEAETRKEEEALALRNVAWLTRVLERYAPHLCDSADSSTKNVWRFRDLVALYARRFSQHILFDTVDCGITPDDFDDVYKLAAVCSAQKFEHPPVAFEDADVRIEGSQGLRAWLFSEKQLVTAGIDESEFAEQKNERGKLPVVVVVNGLSSRDFSLLQRVRLFWQQQGYLTLMVECKPYRRQEDGRLHVHSFPERNRFLLHCVLEHLQKLPYVDTGRILFATHSMGRSVVVDSWKRLVEGGVTPMGLFGIAPPTILSQTGSAFSKDAIAFLIGADDPLLDDCLAAMVPETSELREGFIPGIIPPEKHGLAFHRGDLIAHTADFSPHASRLGFIGQVGKPHRKNPFKLHHDLSFIGTPWRTIRERQRQDLICCAIDDVVKRRPTFGLSQDESHIFAREFVTAHLPLYMLGRHVMQKGNKTLSRKFIAEVMRAHNFDGDPEEINALLAMMWWFVNLLPMNSGPNRDLADGMPEVD